MMSPIARLSAVGRQLTTFQWITLGFLVAMTVIGLVLSGRGEPLPTPVSIGFLVGIVFVSYSAFESLGLINQSPVETGPKPWDVSFERKNRKLNKKKEIQKQKQEEMEAQERVKAELREKQLKERAAAKAAAKAAAEAAKAAKAAEESAAAAAAADAPKKGKGKKKKKPKKEPVVSVPVEESTPEAPEDDGWVVSTSKYEARKEKKAAIVSAGGSITATMMVASRHYSVIIGAKGSTLEKLRSKTGVDINMPSRDSNEETITLTGTQEGIDAAKQAILELAEQGHCQLIHGNVEKVHMTISNLGLLVGKDGAHINAIRTKGKVDIQLPSKGSESKDITLLGDPANIALAVHNIKQLMSMEYCDFTHENYTSVDIKFPGSFLGLLIGPGGERIKAIKDTTKTRINIPKITAKDKDTLYSITITGPALGVENAKLLIAGVQKDFVFAEVDFPSNKIAFLIGEKGRNITALQQKYRSGISVDDHIWDPDLRTITINGFKKDVELVQQEILQIIDIYSIETTTFPKDRMGALIGKAGKHIIELKSKTNCHINFSDHEWDDTVRVVSVEGLTDDVKVCLAEVELLKVRPERKERPVAEATETLAFPKARAGILIGRAGSNIQALQKSTKTRINVSDLNETDKQIVIEGTAEAVAAAVAKIEELRNPAPKKKNSKKDKVEVVEGDADTAEEAKEEATEAAAEE